MKAVFIKKEKQKKGYHIIQKIFLKKKTTKGIPQKYKKGIFIVFF